MKFGMYTPNETPNTPHPQPPPLRGGKKFFVKNAQNHPIFSSDICHYILSDFRGGGWGVGEILIAIISETTGANALIFGMFIPLALPYISSFTTNPPQGVEKKIFFPPQGDLSKIRNTASPNLT